MVASGGTRGVLGDFARFSREYLYANAGCDPEYATLRAIMPKIAPGYDSKLWMLWLYMVYGEVLAGVEAYRRCPIWQLAVDEPESTWKLPTSIERRGFRDPHALAKHLASLVSAALPYETLEKWLKAVLAGHERRDWTATTQRVQQIWGNGRWAGYTTAEALVCVLKYPIEAPDIGNAYSSGPRLGLAHLFEPVVGNSPSAVARLDSQGEALHAAVNNHYGVKMRYEELETVLCNWHELVTGKLYVGRGIDRQQEYIASFRAKGMADTADLVAEARLESLPNEYLGEVGGWSGVDKERKMEYVRSGRILVRGKGAPR